MPRGRTNSEKNLMDAPLDSADLRAAIAASVEAAPVLEQQTLPERAAMLRAVADEIDDDSRTLVSVAESETSLGEPRLTGELARTTAQLRLMADVVEDGSFLEVVVDPPNPDMVPPRPDLRRTLVPLGPVAVFGASNFPFAFSVAGGDTASALAAGCPTLAKAHPGHPLTSRQTAEAVRRGLGSVAAPEGTFALVEGFEAGAALVAHSSIRAVAFTGSFEGGRALFDLAHRRDEPIPFYGELGSLNPVVLTPSAVAARSG
jgi:NADP-dependent aldehyde dehydrogenase